MKKNKIAMPGFRLSRDRGYLVALIAVLLLALTGCGSPGGGDGTVVGSIDEDGNVTADEIALPTDTLLNLRCAEVGIFPETCVLEDDENPFLKVATREFNANDPDAETKFALADKIPAGPTGAKARFYLWATALARFPSGENQWLTALALHELWDAAGDPLIQQQAINAYRSQLDNFFGSVIFFECCAGLIPGDPTRPVPFSATLNELTADNLYRTEATNYARLVPGDPLLTQSLISEWGYTYRPATAPDFNDGLVFLSTFP